MKCFFALLIFTITSGLVSAQDLFKVTESTAAMQKGTQPSFEIFIPEASPKIVEDNWKKFVEKGTRAKLQRAGSEFVIENAVLKSISDEPMNFYSNIQQSENGSVLRVFAEQNEKFISSASHPSESAVLNTLLMEFALESHGDAVNSEMKAEQKKLKSLEKDLRKLINDKQKLERKIRSHEEEIFSYKNDLDVNKRAQQALIERSSNTENPEPIDPKDQKKIQNEAKKIQKKINAAQNKIRKAEREIPVNAQLQKQKKDEIENQRQRIIKISGKKIVK